MALQAYIVSYIYMAQMCHIDETDTTVMNDI